MLHPLLLMALLLAPLSAVAQDTTISYQGQLKLSGAPFTGEADIRFELFDALTSGSQVGPTLIRPAVPVEDGIFQVELDFGDMAFGADVRYLELEVEGTILAPRQPIRPAPTALFALDGNPGPPGPEGPQGPPGPSEPPLFDPAPPPMEVELYLQSASLSGGSDVQGFEDWIPIDRFRTAARLPPDTLPGGIAAGIPSFDPMSIELEAGSWTADFFELLANGASAVFDILACDSDVRSPGECFQFVRLETSYVSRAQPFRPESADRHLLEVDIEYGQLTWELRAPTGETTSMSWDRLTNIGSFSGSLSGPLFSDAGDDAIGQLDLNGISGDLVDGSIALFDSEQSVALSDGLVFTSTGALLSPPEFKPAAMQRRTDAAGPELLYRLATNSPIPSATLDWTSGTSQATISLEQMLVSYLEINSSLREPIELTSLRVHWLVDGNGYGWDFQGNQSWTPTP